MSTELEELPKLGADGPIALRVMTEPCELDALRDAWNELAGHVPFRRWEWLATWWRHFGVGRELRLVVATDSGGQLVGLAPFYAEAGGWSRPRWAMLGSGLVCSDHQTLLALSAYESAFGHAVGGLLRQGGTPWFTLAMEGIVGDDPATQSLVQSLVDAGCGVGRRENSHCWRTSLDENWETFVLRFAKRRRTTVRQLCRRCFDEGQFEVHFVESTRDLEKAWPILVELHQKRQTQLGNPGCFSTPAFARFLREAAERFLELGQLRLHWLRREGRPVAAQFDLVGGDTQYHYLSGLEPEVLADRPGRVGMLVMLHRAIGEGLRSYDFLRGDHRYKSDWLAEPTELLEWRVAAPGVLARLDLLRWQGAVRARAMAKRWFRRDHGSE